MGKRKRRHRSSDDEDREKLRNRVEWLEEQILKQREEKYESKRSNRRQSSSRSRSRSQAHKRSREAYDSPRSQRRSSRCSYHSEQESYDDYANREGDNRRPRHSHAYRRERSDSHMRRTETSSDRARSTRSESPKEDFGSQMRAHSISPSLDEPQERVVVPDDGPIVAQEDEQATASSPVTIAVKAKPGTEEVPREEQETELEADVLEVFGERLRPERVLAPAVHSHFATLWFEIVEKGLPAEKRKAFLKKISPPQNCVFIDPPKLNLEVVLTRREKNSKRT